MYLALFQAEKQPVIIHQKGTRVQLGLANSLIN